MTSSPGLIVVDGEIGVMKKGSFFAHTNFVFEVTCVVYSPDGVSIPMNGHLYRIRTKEGVERLVDVVLYSINVIAVTIGVHNYDYRAFARAVLN